MLDTRSKWLLSAMFLGMSVGLLTGLALGNLVLGATLGLISASALLILIGQAGSDR